MSYKPPPRVHPTDRIRRGHDPGLAVNIIDGPDVRTGREEQEAAEFAQAIERDPYERDESIDEEKLPKGKLLSVAKAREHEEQTRRFLRKHLSRTERSLDLNSSPDITYAERGHFSFGRNPATQLGGELGERRLFPVVLDDAPFGSSEIQNLLAPEHVTEGEIRPIDEVYAQDKNPPIYRQSKTYPKKFQGGLKGKAELIQSTVPGGGYAVKPRTKELEILFDKYRLENSGEFLRSLEPFELALNAAKQEPTFRLADIVREFNQNNPDSWISLPEGRRRQTAFNKKVAAWKEAGVDPNRIASTDSAPEDQRALYGP